MYVLIFFEDFIKNLLFLIIRFLSNINLIGEYFSNPDSRQVNFELSKFKVFVITNQPDVGRGLIKKETLKKMHKSLKKNIKINKIFTCIHKPEKKCKCRKPSPEMIFKAAKLYKIDLKKSFLIGDRLSDILSGKKAGCRTVFINRNYKEKKPNNQETSVANLEEATKYIINNNE